MSENRTIVLNLNAVEIAEITKATLDDWGNCGFHTALTYLGTWNLAFPVVRIQKDFGENNLLAIYEREDGSTGYVIGAIWSSTDGKYSFHS